MQAQPRARKASALYELCSLRPEGQGDQEVCYPEHCGVCGGPGYYWGVGVSTIHSAQVVREAALLRVVRHPQQGREESFQGGPSYPRAATKELHPGQCSTEPEPGSQVTAAWLEGAWLGGQMDGIRLWNVDFIKLVNQCSKVHIFENSFVSFHLPYDWLSLQEKWKSLIEKPFRSQPGSFGKGMRLLIVL